jgi:hypothetical protein
VTRRSIARSLCIEIKASVVEMVTGNVGAPTRALSALGNMEQEWSREKF